MGCVGTMIKNICPVKGPKSYYIVKREHFTNKEKWMNGVNTCFFQRNKGMRHFCVVLSLVTTPENLSLVTDTAVAVRSLSPGGSIYFHST